LDGLIRGTLDSLYDLKSELDKFVSDDAGQWIAKNVRWYCKEWIARTDFVIWKQDPRRQT